MRKASIINKQRLFSMVSANIPPGVTWMLYVYSSTIVTGYNELMIADPACSTQVGIFGYKNVIFAKNSTSMQNEKEFFIVITKCTNTSFLNDKTDIKRMRVV